ncbi:MAG: T9SS type A sorting domain-containing protein [Bacteroidota bacterium]
MMRIFFIFLSAFLFFAKGNAQYTIERDVFCTFGNYAVDPATGLSLSYTAGETVIKTGQSLFGSLVLTQGFQQAEGFTVGIDDPVQFLVSYEVYPNPTAGLVNIALKSDRPAIMYLRVMDILGQEVGLPTQQMRFSRDFTTQLDLSALADGFYLIGLLDESKRLIATVRIEKVY